MLPLTGFLLFGEHTFLSSKDDHAASGFEYPRLALPSPPVSKHASTEFHGSRIFQFLPGRINEATNANGIDTVCLFRFTSHLHFPV